MIWNIAKILPNSIGMQLTEYPVKMLFVIVKECPDIFTFLVLKYMNNGLKFLLLYDPHTHFYV